MFVRGDLVKRKVVKTRARTKLRRRYERVMPERAGV